MTTTFRNAIFQLHWFFGITAGIVLALVGATGAMLSFEHEILKSLNPGVVTVQARGDALAPDALVARIRAEQPDSKLQSLALSADPHESAKAGFAPKADAPKGPGGRARGESRYVDPYTGNILPKPRGEGFFRTTMQLHRWLVMDDIGKQIVGFSTVVLVFFCLSGVYLRWPRRWLSPRAWFALDWRQKGRNFLWHLHSIVGTWVLVLYLVMALTGLSWSYDWYRDGINRLAGVPQQAQAKSSERTREKGAVGGRSKRPAEAGSKQARDVDVAAAWRAFEAIAPAWSTATLQWPRDDGGIQFRYLDANPPHERANNQLELDPDTLAVRKHERYDAKPTAQQLAGSMFALHRGSYFGMAGVVLFMLASLLMPLFAITGWMLYLDRRRKQHAARALAQEQPQGPIADGETVLIAYASQTGSAERLAWQTAASLREAGVATRVERLGRLQPADLATVGRALFVVSTFGEGQPPDSARGFARRMVSAPPSLVSLRYAVLALGDREYDSYCEFGRTLDHWLHHAGAQPLFDRIDVDAGDAGALRHWQHHLGQLAGRSDLADWAIPAYAPWRLHARTHLNPGSPGGGAYHVELLPPAGSVENWKAGDIAEIGPRHSQTEVAVWLAAGGIDGSSMVQHQDKPIHLAHLLARSLLPDIDAVRSHSAQRIADALQPLPHREYSIASLPADGSLQLLVRQMCHPDGRLGSGSGWLTAHAALGDMIDVRIRSNPSFHLPIDARPIVLVGNGTGIAGLRSLLKARIAAGHTRNWMLFGERTAAHDFHFRDEVQGWLSSGGLEYLDLAFSRDQADRRYVQHLLQEQRERLREWLDAGAAVYVCGSLEGMAPAVDAVLRDVVGLDALEAMAEEGRYRRDVY